MCILLMMGIGCDGERNDTLMAYAEAYMETRADSARWLLQQVDTVLTEKQQARYALLWTQAMHKCHIPLGNDSLINVAVDYYSRTGERHLLAKSLLYKGLVHKQHGEVEQAVEAFVAGEQAFEGVDDDQYKALLFNHYASVLQKQGMYNDALAYYKKSYQHKLLGDSLHYVVSACSQIARMYEMINEKDSAQIYYKKGLFHADNMQRKEYQYALLQNYAAFLLSCKQYVEAEQLLKESEDNAYGSVYIYNVYSALSTLYYETGEYEKAIAYGEKIMESTDSLMLRGCFLHLYRAYRQKGEMEKAVHYHDLYRVYDNDITMRQKTAEVAVIPHRIKNAQLMAENHKAHRWQWVWGIAVAVAVSVAIWIVRSLRRKHGRQMEVMDAQLDAKEQELGWKDGLLAEKESLLQEIEQKMYDLKMKLGRVRGAMSNQHRVLANLKNDRKEDKLAYQESVRELKKSLKEKGEELKIERKAVQERFGELNKRLNHSEKEQKRWINEVAKLTEQMKEYELLQQFLLDTGLVRPVLLILELKSGHSNNHYTIRHEDYATLLKQLADYAHPGIRELIENTPVLKDKQELASLIALGYEDMEMMRIATNLKQNSVRAYSSQIKAVIGSWKSDVLRVMS